MQLIQLVALEIEKLVDDYAKLLDQIEHYEKILADEQMVLNIIKKETRELKAK